MPAFLLEIGLEEIPAGMIAAAQAEFEENFRELVERERLVGEGFSVRSYSTPRRLAVLADGLLSKQADIVEQVVGPSVSVAYKNGTPTPAAIAFAKKSGVEIGALQSIRNAKGEYVAATVSRQGRSAADVLTAKLPGEISGIYWPKNMYWRAGKPERFVRPVRWLLALLDEEVLPLEFAGVTADGVTYGHRILHGDAPVVIRKLQEYKEKLTAAFVQVDPEARKHRIRKALDAATRTVPGARWREDEALVETVTNLTEWPNVILGSFDPLRLPKEVLITVMRDHQKYFALEDANGSLLPHFLAVLNIEVDAAGADIIRHGNERVLRARFNDARFFWDVDQKIPLVDRVEMLKHVTFHKDLGSYWDKTKRNMLIAERIQKQIEDRPQVLRVVENAAKLAKVDLTTEMVKEFTELQGIVGGLYAAYQGVDGISLAESAVDGSGVLTDASVKEIAAAIYDHYKPVSMTDPIPQTEAGCVVAIADKVSTIVDMFDKGFQPTGSKDPFALRRAGNGVIRILVESESVRYRLDLASILKASFTDHEGDDYSSRIQLLEFMLDRLEFYLQESSNIRLQVARAVRRSTAANNYNDRADDLVGYGHIASFAKELNEQIGSSDVLAVAELLKRTSNILRQAREKKIVYSPSELSALLKEPAEIELARRVTEANERIQKSYREGNYNEVIAAIAALQPSLNAFFDSVMVMVEDDKLRNNRLALLARAESTVRWAADFSELASIQ
ncbi:MAG: glycine--tRNA ligase subunit beta [Acidobacteriaceae bacterium]